MWFRKTETLPETDVVAAENNNNNNHAPSKFEKFRRASFRRKSTSNVATSQKRSKSPHHLLQPESDQQRRNATLVEALKENTDDDDDDDDDTDNDDSTDDEKHIQTIGGVNHNNGKLKNKDNPTIGTAELYKTQVKIPIRKAPDPPRPLLTAISDPTMATKAQFSKKNKTLKALKTDPPKRKFYKNFTSTAKRQHSHESIVKISENSADDRDHDDDGDDNDDNLPANCKEKILLTDPKYRNNRIEKSSSKTKISDIERRESIKIKRSRSGRKISAPPVLIGSAGIGTGDDKKQSKKKSSVDKTTEDQTRARSYSNLNLQALVKFVVNNKKFLNTEDFALIRRKSISEAASSIITVAATCKPLPIALKYGQDGAVAETPLDHDAKAEKNVVLVKKQNLKNSFNDHVDGDQMSKAAVRAKLKKVSTPSISSIASASDKSSGNKVKRNSSNSSKSSGNFEDEAFYSCDEQDQLEKLGGGGSGAVTVAGEDAVVATISKRKSSSPSLTSRVAAKINETTNNYKNRKAAAAASKSAAKKRKSLAKRPEYYKQISVGEHIGRFFFWKRKFYVDLACAQQILTVGNIDI